MNNNAKNSVLDYYQETFEELCVINSIVKLVKNSCLEREFSGQYYGIPPEKIIHLSEERNNYINMLTVLSERVTNVMNLHEYMEVEKSLHNNSDNSSRKITTKCTANQSS